LIANGNVIRDVPIGTVVAWVRDLPSPSPDLTLPSGWVLCSGQVLADSASPLNGRTIPNLNGNNLFLRGDTASGGTGGSDSHDHGGYSDDTAAGSDYQSTSYYSQTSNVSNLPPYYEVLWVMRVR
jgi:hypothetical protein